MIPAPSMSIDSETDQKGMTTMTRTRATTLHRRHLLGAAGLAAVPLLTGNPRAILAQDAVEVVFRQNDPPVEIGGLEEAIEKLNSSDAGIQVKLENIAWADAQAQWVREVQAGGGPDVQQLAFVWPQDLASTGLLLELDELIAGSDIAPDDFLALGLGQLDGKTYGIPWSADTFVIAYRPDLLDEAGVQLPSGEVWDPGTWEAFRDTAESLSNGSDQFGFAFPAGPEGWTWFLANYYLWSNGTTLIQDDGSGTWAPGVTAEDLTGAMDYFNSFFERGITPESLIAVSTPGDPQVVGGLGRGDAAMSFFPPSTFRAAQAESESPLATALMPSGSETRISHLGGRMLGINPSTEHPEEAWQVIEHLISAETFETYDQYPARQSILESLETPEGEEAYAEMLPQAITFEQYISSPVPVPSLQEAVNRSFGAVFSGQQASADAAGALVDEIAGLIERGEEG
jgi:multiple sugar transport system substrate-binding protein